MTSAVVQVDNEKEVIIKLCDLIQSAAEKAIAKDNRFTVGLSGGSLIKYLCTGLPDIKTDWRKWTLLFCDERVVPVDNEDSTYGVYKRDLIGKVPLSEDQFVKIKQGVSAEEAAIDYRQQLEKHVKFSDGRPRFHLLLLGMGPDGHTCSLFPGHPLLDETSVTVASIVDSPKPPPQRVTLTYPVINNAECCVFAMSGKGKAEMLKRIFIDKECLPAARVKPSNGTLYWIADKEACSML